MNGLDLFGNVSTADSGERSEHDFYETPAWMTRTLLHHAPFIRDARHVLEPCSGRGAIERVLVEAGIPIVQTNDIDARQPALWHMDAACDAFWSRYVAAFGRPDWSVTNVAFVVAYEVLGRAFEASTIGVAMLLNKTFTEPTEKRGAWLREHPPSATICLPRHSFRGQGSAPTATDWFLWLKEGAQGPFADWRWSSPFVIDPDAESR